MVMVSRMGLPLSMDSMVASSSLFSSMMSAIFSRMAARLSGSGPAKRGTQPRRPGRQHPHLPWLPQAHSASFSPVAGLVVVIFPTRGATHCPLI